MDFVELIEESYRGFATGSYLELDELRLLYYGRWGIYVTFTDDGSYDFETTVRELDRPDGVLCHSLNDVIARRVSSSEFYANVLRIDSSGVMSDIRRYTRDDFMRDVTKLREQHLVDDETFDGFLYEVQGNVRIRYDFQRLWDFTEELAKEKGGGDFGKEWKKMLMGLGYDGFTDPHGTGIIAAGKRPVTLYMDYRNRRDLDILPIQKNRKDPRLHTRQQVERMADRMQTRRNRVAKHNITRDY